MFSPQRKFTTCIIEQQESTKNMRRETKVKTFSGELWGTEPRRGFVLILELVSCFIHREQSYMLC